MNRFLFILAFVLIQSQIWASFLPGEKRTFKASRTTEKIQVDGKFNEPAWMGLEEASDFYVYEPVNGAKSNFLTSVKVLYDDHAIYFAARMDDPQPDSIARELTERDNQDGYFDAFCVELNPYNDSQNSFSFWVTAANVQVDYKNQSSSRDFGWDAVWDSEIAHIGNGWQVEIKIPYSAIRIPKTGQQLWGVNFWRQIKRVREWSVWNFVNKEISEPTSQEGLLTGIENIDPPLRLALYPYLSGYSQFDTTLSNASYSLNGGLDLKLGLDESFTLDMTLIPDFGQTTTDDVVLNLSPFEVRYDEKRSFFTEGTELFNKSGLLYSRRIGDTPEGYYDVYDQIDEDEEVVHNPSATQLINASKISGRNQNNLGLGFFNAISNNTYATVRDSEGNERHILTAPLKNYNILVLDQAFRNNSYLNLINTNVFEPDNHSIANVAGAKFNLMDHQNTWGINGNIYLSYRDGFDDTQSEFGHSLRMGFGKYNGKLKYNYSFRMMNNTYNPNDLGFLRHNNETGHTMNVSYNEYNPGKFYLNYWSSFRLNYEYLYTTGQYTSLSSFIRSGMTLKNYITLGLNFHASPIGRQDFYEPRLEGWKYKAPASISGTAWISTDYRKDFALDARLGGYLSDETEKGYWIELGPRIRLSRQFFIEYEINFNTAIDDYGYVVDNEIDTVLFGLRNKNTIENTINASYVFNNKSYLKLYLRHFWSQVDYTAFALLDHEGILNPTIHDEEALFDVTATNQDINFNVFSIDLVYSWNFAPGSFLNLVWKNYISPDANTSIDMGFWDNFTETLQSYQSNSLSFKLIYYFDYQYLFPGA